MPNSVSPWTTVYRSPIVGTGDVGIVGCVGGAVCGANVGAAVGGGGLVDGASVVGAVAGTNTVVVGAVDVVVVLLAVPIGTSGGLSKLRSPPHAAAVIATTAAMTAGVVRRFTRAITGSLIR